MKKPPPGVGCAFAVALGTVGWGVIAVIIYSIAKLL